MIQRDYLSALIKNKLQEHAKIPAVVGDDKERNSYTLGHSLGYSDALKDVLKMLDNVKDLQPW